MKKLTLFALLVGATTIPLAAQQAQIPTLQVCNVKNPIVGGGTAFIASRSPLGDFSVRVQVFCDANGYPTGSLAIYNINMNDSTVQGTVTATSFDQLTATGTVTPTAYLAGRCDYTQDGVTFHGGHYWILFAHNSSSSATGGPGGSPDVVSFLVFDKTGKRIAYGTSPLQRGQIIVPPQPPGI